MLGDLTHRVKICGKCWIFQLGLGKFGKATAVLIGIDKDIPSGKLT